MMRGKKTLLDEALKSFCNHAVHTLRHVAAVYVERNLLQVVSNIFRANI